MSISVPPKGDELKRAGAFFSSLRVEAQGIPNLTVKITEGGFWLNEFEYVEFSGGNSPVINIPPVDQRWVLVSLAQSGNIVLVYGAISSNPVLPELPDDRMPLAGILVGATNTVISEGMIFDLRPFLKIGARVAGVTLQDIVGLQAALDEKVDITEYLSGLALKADMNGTIDPTFTLNKDQTGTPNGNIHLDVERGAEPSVGIRWNEVEDRWEFTNDGSAWSAIGDTTIDASAVLAIVEASDLDGGLF